jgi:predicted MPP superfamily phosphohydrolase
MSLPIRRTFPKHIVAPALGAAFLGLGCLAYAFAIEPARFEVCELSLPLPRLAPEFSGYRVVQISDIHMDGWMNRTRLAEVVERVNRLEPHLVAITGDFVTYTPARFAEDLIQPLKRLAAPDGVMAVLGNHDHWSGPHEVRRILRQAGLADLSNTIHTVKRGKAALHVAGIDDYAMGYDRLDRVLEQLPEDGAAILLAHEPDFADISAASGRFDLQLSGHSHGGQIRLPLIGIPYLPDFGRKYPRGLYRVGKMIQYTNRGLGTVHLHFRFNSRPEITLFTFNP